VDGVTFRVAVEDSAVVQAKNNSWMQGLDEKPLVEHMIEA
jgi:hypothetical protein